MFLNYTKVAIRRLLKNKIYLLINVLGVGIAIASAMTAYLLVAYNIEFDSTVDEGRVKNIVKVVHHRKQADGDSFKQLVAPLPLGPSTAEDIAGVKNFTRYCSIGGYISHNGNGFHETIFFADSAFMNMFRPELISGSHQNFGDRNSIFISEKFARKYFGTEDPVGKELTVYANSKTTIVNVGGVLKDVPFNSTFTYNALMRMENFISTLNYKENDWASNETASTLFELTDIRHAHTIARQLQRYVSMRNEFQAEARSVSYELLPFMTAISPNDMRGSDLHLRIPNIALFTFILMGSIILLIACFNLTNTTLALSMKRLKEIGIRKVVGSARWQIAFQFFVEIVLTTAFAGIVGFALSLYLIPEFAAMWELPYGLKELNSMNIVIALMVLLFTCALVAGIYPALFASGLNPIVLFRGSKNAGGTNLLTRTLLVTQFSLSIIVLIAGVMFSRNALYQDTLSFGYDKGSNHYRFDPGSTRGGSVVQCTIFKSEDRKHCAFGLSFCVHQCP